MSEVVDKFIDHIAIQLNYSPNTVESYRRDLYQFYSFLSSECENTSLEDVKSSDIKNWILKLMQSESITSRTMSRKISSLRSFYKYLIISGDIDVNPADRVILPKIGKRLPEFVTEDKMMMALDPQMFESGFKGVRNKMVIDFLYMTGVRVSELTAIKLIDIDLFDLVVKVTGKRRKERLIPLGKNLEKSLRDYLLCLHNEFGDTTFFIVNNNGGQASRSFIYDLVNKHLHKVSTQKKLSPHVLRHTFATHLLNNGADINAIKELLGHSSLASTQVYTHNSIKKLKSIYNQAHPRA